MHAEKQFLSLAVRLAEMAWCFEPLRGARTPDAMGYDITFHPVSGDEIQRYVFDVIERPDLADTRAASISDDSEKRRGSRANL